MNEPKRTTLSRKLLTGLAIFTAALIAVTTLLVGLHYYSVRMGIYASTAHGYAHAAAKFIDGDRILVYLDPKGTDENGDPIYKTDEYYDTVQKYLTAAQSEYVTVKYYYVFVPYEDDLIYVWDSDASAEYSPLGYREDYMDDGKAAVDRVFNKDPQEDLFFFNDETYGKIACAYYPIYDSNDEPVAIVGVDLAVEGIERELLRYILTNVAAIVLVAAAASVIFFSLVNRVLVKPVSQLNSAAKSLVDNLDKNENTALDIHTGDELEELSGSFLKMHSDLREYIRELSLVTAEKERIGAELNVAAQIQADMLPRIFPAFPDRKGFDLYASMEPAKEVGGDFYDFFLVDDDHLALVMADVSGKGVPAALFMVIAKTLIKNRILLGESPAEALRNVNDQLCEGNEAQLFVTVWLAVIDLSTGRGIAANAGHEHPALRRAGGQYELVVYRHSPVVAAMEHTRYREHEFELRPGDSLFVYTDGVAEAKNAQRKLYKTDRMLEALNRDPGASPKDAIAAVQGSVEAYVGEAPQFDDITMLCLRYAGPEKGSMKDGNTLLIAADIDRIRDVKGFAGEILERNECPRETRLQIFTALEELFVNIASYAYPEGKGWAEIRVDVEKGEALVTLTDGGVPYDPLKKPDPDVTLSSEERKIGGLGIYMTKKLMDTVEYEYREGKNVLTLKKRLAEQVL